MKETMAEVTSHSEGKPASKTQLGVHYECTCGRRFPTCGKLMQHVMNGKMVHDMRGESHAVTAATKLALVGKLEESL